VATLKVDWIFTFACAAYNLVRILGGQWGFWEGTFLGALVLGVYANWFQGKLRIPAEAILLPDIMLLVPGSTALRAAYLAATQGYLPGLKAANEALILVGCILAGLLAGNIILPSSEGKAES